MAVSQNLGRSVPAPDYRDDPRLEKIRTFFA
jgi:hypothetical protein